MAVRVAQVAITECFGDVAVGIMAQALIGTFPGGNAVSVVTVGASDDPCFQ
jgi:hypothetical protein